ncbi:MAG TPA: carbon-monoxide dehydrogenase catalytic subunit [Persephonella sp.]|uniref:Carbon monoxide dehydrogenase n=1 Tax=Persephonella marina (strain DSM 14350 / EX-H1) TaxID=123214 RepID=C0QT89_PERMH|nr:MULTISPECIES: anaerobic carbon-monoxide dehydrogenase catalytic subunit [Persephonella]ACO03445.1 carbon-monoxide dehydrogenase, catalytic subunit [Persephonella marina EX-H1]HCB70477.1 carbon-monoxide dehydrogenase catalytic subunit [Persephonella sp.]
MSCDYCITPHESVKEMHSFLTSMGFKHTFFERVKRQGAICYFGEQGRCCTLCPDGPCRIKRRAPKGKCGIDADGLAARNLLRLVNQGGAAYTHDFKTTLKTLKAIAEGKSPFRVSDRNKLLWFAGSLGLDTEGTDEEIIGRLADFLEREFMKDLNEPLTLIEKLAPESRVEIWKSLGIIPGGYIFESHEASAKVMPNIDTDYIDLALTSLRLGLSAGFLANIATTVIRDIIFGSPDITEGYADIGVLDKDYVNIVVHGHVPWMGSIVAKKAKTAKFQNIARSAGAKGIKVYGSLCTGQELLQRPETAKYLDGQVGNWLTQEFVAATGAVDAFLMDKNCAAPGMANLVQSLKLHTKLIPVSSVVRLKDVEARSDFMYDPVKAEEQAERLIMEAIDAYKNRRKTYKIHIPERKTHYIAGFGIESILKVLGGTPDPLFEAIQDGTIKGVVGLVSCTTMKNGHGTFTYDFVKELLKRDILVLIAGCASSLAQVEGFTNSKGRKEFAGPGLRALCEALDIPPVLNFGSCLDTGRMALLIIALSEYLGVDPSALPVVAAAPEYYNNDALIDGLLAVSLGINTYVNPVPPIVGGPGFTRLLTRDLENLLGARFMVEPDAVKAAQMIEEELIRKVS